MFNSLLAKLGIGEDRAPIFHYYLKRHAELDGDEHGPAALRLVATLCGDDPARLAEAVEAANAALASRARLWDRVLATLNA
jgi:phage FluMu protein gp41